MNYLKQYGREALGWVLLLCLVGVSLFILSMAVEVWNPPVAQPATQSTKVTKLETKTVEPKQVVVYEAKAKSKLNLPKHVQADTKQHVVAATTVKASVRPQTTTTVLDETTGHSTTYVTVDPYPWLGANPSGSMSLSYGLRKTEPVVRLSITQDLFQIKALNFGGVAHLDSDGQHFIGLGATYRW